MRSSRRRRLRDGPHHLDTLDGHRRLVTGPPPDAVPSDLGFTSRFFLCRSEPWPVNHADAVAARAEGPKICEHGCDARAAVVPGVTHLFEEPGTLEAAATLPGAGSSISSRPHPNAPPDRRSPAIAPPSTRAAAERDHDSSGPPSHRPNSALFRCQPQGWIWRRADRAVDQAAVSTAMLLGLLFARRATTMSVSELIRYE